MLFFISYGLASGFAVVYWANLFFPVKYASQTINYFNMIARIATITSPWVM